MELLSPNGIGIELGVAKGFYSAWILESPNIDKLFSVDRWAGDRRHNFQEMAIAASNLARFKERSIIIKASFNQIIDIFPDKHFDYIYCDAYAHLGYLDILTAWYPKLKKHGLFAVHDYHPKWPNNIAAINEFCKQHKLSNENVCTDDKFYTWWTIKK